MHLILARNLALISLNIPDIWLLMKFKMATAAVLNFTRSSNDLQG